MSAVRGVKKVKRAGRTATMTKLAAGRMRRTRRA